jgi:cytochrome c-type biogenesis protein CcmH
MRMPAVILLLLLAASAIVQAKFESVAFATAEQEQRYRALISELRCLVCQNQTIADSNADLAKDLRRQIREMIGRGDSDQTIIDFMVARYGDFVLYRPPFKAITALLWVGPFLFLAGGLIVMIVVIHKRSRATRPPLSESEQARVRDELLRSSKDD